MWRWPRRRQQAGRPHEPGAAAANYSFLFLILIWLFVVLLKPFNRRNSTISCMITRADICGIPSHLATEHCCSSCARAHLPELEPRVCPKGVSDGSFIPATLVWLFLPGAAQAPCSGCVWVSRAISWNQYSVIPFSLHSHHGNGNFRWWHTGTWLTSAGFWFRASKSS